MANVQVMQRHAHLAGEVRIEYIGDHEARIAKATLVAISNTRWGSGASRKEQATSVQWIVWGSQAENAAMYLGTGSHVNILGRLQNKNFQKEGETQYRSEFTAEEIDYLDSKADAEARRATNRQAIAAALAKARAKA